MTSYVFVAERGGTGSSVMAQNLAGYLASKHRRVLLVDIDKATGASLVWGGIAQSLGRTLPFAVSSAPANGFDDVIWDCATGVTGRVRELPRADVIVMPTLLDAASQILLEQAMDALDRVGLKKKVVVVPNRVRLDRADQSTMLQARYLDTPYLRDRSAYAAGLSGGCTLYDVDQGNRWLNDCRTEFETVARRIVRASRQTPKASRASR